MFKRRRQRREFSALIQAEVDRVRPAIEASVERIEDLADAARDELRTAPGMCPGCGHAMVLRKARRGRSKGQQFWGCSQYPACRTTRRVGEHRTVHLGHER